MFGVGAGEKLDCVCLAAEGLGGVGCTRGIRLALSARLDVWPGWPTVPFGDDYVWDVFTIRFRDALPRFDGDKMGVLHKLCDHNDNAFNDWQSSG